MSSPEGVAEKRLRQCLKIDVPDVGQSTSGTSVNRHRGHRSIDIGDIDFEVVLLTFIQKRKKGHA